ncbi:hypothetical protein J6P92_08835 [bacterium]|nr:hypothetical protein [bacterium]
MSKSIGRVFGSGSVKTYGYENNYINYLKNYDTSNYDRAQDNMTSQALNMSKGLNMLPEYQFGVDYSDEARKRAEDATYQSYVDKLVPQYRQQMSDLQTNLVNQGIPVGSEAYLRATGNLQNSQNEALNQAAYQSVLNGQNSYSQALADSLKVADFSNDARQSYIDQIKSLLAGSVSGYENASNLYDVKRGVKNRQAAAQQSGWNNLGSIVSSVTSAITAGKK